VKQPRGEISREELERIIKICENIERMGLDPFTVNIRELLERLRRMLEENPNLDHYVLDAETLYRIATLIAFQHHWLEEKAKALFIDSQMVSTRVAVMDKKELVQAFLKAWRPIVFLEQLTAQRLQHGLEHFLSLPPRSGGREYGWKLTDREYELAEARLRMETELMAEKMRKMHEELLERAESMGGEVDYWEFVRGRDLEETFERAYVLSFMITEGYAELRRNPLKGEIKLVPNKEKRERQRSTSLVIALRGEAA